MCLDLLFVIKKTHLTPTLPVPDFDLVFKMHDQFGIPRENPLQPSTIRGQDAIRCIHFHWHLVYSSTDNIKIMRISFLEQLDYVNNLTISETRRFPKKLFFTYEAATSKFSISCLTNMLTTKLCSSSGSCFSKASSKKILAGEKSRYDSDHVDVERLVC